MPCPGRPRHSWAIPNVETDYIECENCGRQMFYAELSDSHKLYSILKSMYNRNPDKAREWDTAYKKAEKASFDRETAAMHDRFGKMMNGS